MEVRVTIYTARAHDDSEMFPSRFTSSNDFPVADGHAAGLQCYILPEKGSIEPLLKPM